MCDAYKKISWNNINVTEVILDVFGGHLAVVDAVTDTGVQTQEMCFITANEEVRIFETTEELARFLDQKARAPWMERIFYRPTFTGIILLLLIAAVVGLGNSMQPQVLTLLGGILGSAAGYFFGISDRAK